MHEVVALPRQSKAPNNPTGALGETTEWYRACVVYLARGFLQIGGCLQSRSDPAGRQRVNQPINSTITRIKRRPTLGGQVGTRSDQSFGIVGVALDDGRHGACSRNLGAFGYHSCGWKYRIPGPGCLAPLVARQCAAGSAIRPLAADSGMTADALPPNPFLRQCCWT